MKKLGLFSIIVLLGVIGFSASATNVRKEFSNCEINSVDDLHLGKRVQKIWTLAYSKDEVPVTVVKTKNLEGTNYIVRSEFFEVTYLASSNGFGVIEMKRSWRNVPKVISDAVLNREEIKKQAIITPNKIDDEYAVQLIAAFLPQLINEGYTHLLN
jgi:hypothetical protein